MDSFVANVVLPLEVGPAMQIKRTVPRASTCGQKHELASSLQLPRRGRKLYLSCNFSDLLILAEFALERKMQLFVAVWGDGI